MYTYPPNYFPATAGRLDRWSLEVSVVVVPSEVKSSMSGFRLADWRSIPHQYLLQHIVSDGRQTSTYPWNVKESLKAVKGSPGYERMKWYCPRRKDGCRMSACVVSSLAASETDPRLFSLWSFESHSNHSGCGFTGRGVTSEEIGHMASLCGGFSNASVRAISLEMELQRKTAETGVQLKARQVSNAKPNARNQKKNRRGLEQMMAKSIPHQAVHSSTGMRTPAPTVSAFTSDPTRATAYLACGRSQNTVEGLRAAIDSIELRRLSSEQRVKVAVDGEGDDLRWCATCTSLPRLKLLWDAQQSAYWGSGSMAMDGTHSPTLCANVVALTALMKDTTGSCSLVGVALTGGESTWSINEFKNHLQSLVRESVPGGNASSFTLKHMYVPHDGGTALFASGVDGGQLSLDDPRHLFVNVFKTLDAAERTIQRHFRNRPLTPAEKTTLRCVLNPSSSSQLPPAASACFSAFVLPPSPSPFTASLSSVARVVRLYRDGVRGIRELTGPDKFVVARLARAILELLDDLTAAHPQLLGVAHTKLKGYLSRARNTHTQDSTAHETGLSSLSPGDSVYDVLPLWMRGIHDPTVLDDSSVLEGQHNGLKTAGGPFSKREGIGKTIFKLSQFLAGREPQPYEKEVKPLSADLVEASAMFRSALYPLLEIKCSMKAYAGGWLKKVPKSLFPSATEWKRLDAMELQDQAVISWNDSGSDFALLIVAAQVVDVEKSTSRIMNFLGGAAATPEVKLRKLLTVYQAVEVVTPLAEEYATVFSKVN
jgi:hypothetical protein